MTTFNNAFRYLLRSVTSKDVFLSLTHFVALWLEQNPVAQTKPSKPRNKTKNMFTNPTESPLFMLRLN